MTTLIIFLFDPILTLRYNDPSDIFYLCQPYLSHHSLMLIAIPPIRFTIY